MKIAMAGFRAVGDQYGLGGIERVVAEIGPRLVAQGHEVTLFCRDRYADGAIARHQGMRVRPLGALYTKNWESPSNAFLASLRCLRGYDVVHFHATLPALFSGLPRLFGTTTVVTVHGLDWRRAKWGPIMTRIQKLGAYAAGKWPNGCVVCSKTLRRHYRETYGVEARYIPNGVNATAPRPLDKARRFGVEADEYVLFLSRLVPEKGAHTLIEAFRKVETSKKLVIAGGAPYMDAYSRRLKELAEGDDRVVFTGAVHGADKEELFSNAALFCLPSEIEGMAIVILEAMNFGRCALVSDIPENREVVDPTGFRDGTPSAPDAPDRYGWTFRSNDANDLAEQMSFLLDHPETAETLGRRARPHVHKTFNWERATREHLVFYQDLLG